MATMIPSRLDDSVASAGERRLFSLLETDSDTSRWIALHSLGLARRQTGPYGEIDFVVIIPGEGVLCLEVKGGRVSCDDGVWRTRDRRGNVNVLKKSPFLQARESMFALREALRHHFGAAARVARCPFGCAVVFPDVLSPPLTPEFQRTDVIDFDDLRAPISRSILRIAQRRLREFQTRSEGSIPTIAEAKVIRNFLRPDFDLVIARGVSIEHSEAKLLRLTEEQYARLDELEANPRCLFEGAAGTGKTLLALEYARRVAKTGASVLFVCFNRLLGEWLQERAKGTNVTAGTWHSLVKRILLESTLKSEFLERERRALSQGDMKLLFDEIYPLYAQLALEEAGPRYTVLVVDEAQDLCTISTLDALNLTIPGGLAGGHWAIFGDFTRQALYGAREDPSSSLMNYTEYFVRAKLTMNCRNTRLIAEETSLIAGFERPPFRMAEENGLPVEHRYWKSRSELPQLITALVDRLVREQTSPDQIVILSSRRFENSSLAGVERLGRLPLVDISRGDTTIRPALRFSTIHSFKGLESSVVIILDIDEVDTEEPQALLYVAMSRARSLLILFISEAARTSVERRLRVALERSLQR